MGVSGVWDMIGESISAAAGNPFHCGAIRAVGGGCINSAYLVTDGAERFFVKLNQADALAMFAAEAEGLDEIAATRTVRVPRPICSGVADGRAFLVLEFIEFKGSKKAAGAALGRRLASMHRVVAPSYGWHRANTIGATPQINTCADRWPDFWKKHRLGFQLGLAEKNGYRGTLQRRGELLLSRLDVFFLGYEPQPSLLHGDLWGGNFEVAMTGEPVIFDPAVYFGDREADLAMTELFGGFPGAFYSAYRESFPVDAGYPARRTLYNLYHVLNHLNLFGGGYLGQAEGMIFSLLAEIS